MKNLIKGFIFAAFALSFAACKNDKPASETATATEATSKPETSATSTSMATPNTTAEMPVPPSAGVASVSKTATEPVKPVSAQTTPAVPIAAPVGKTTTIKFEETSYAWGSVNEGNKMTHMFKFKNAGSNDLIISDAHGSCGCTVPEWPKEPIKPGKSGVIKVVFDSKGKPGDQQKTVTLTANTEPANTVLTIKGAVKPAATQ